MNQRRVTMGSVGEDDQEESGEGDQRRWEESARDQGDERVGGDDEGSGWTGAEPAGIVSVRPARVALPRGGYVPRDVAGARTPTATRAALTVPRKRHRLAGARPHGRSATRPGGPDDPRATVAPAGQPPAWQARGRRSRYRTDTSSALSVLRRCLLLTPSHLAEAFKAVRSSSDATPPQSLWTEVSGFQRRSTAP